ncbi:RNA methyltransferase [Flavobacterium silvaticum]|uniref:RNA methyltransferase n=1 Tax=Flavobacterium silvaticum TaxID=1852020 RepID=A0A972FS37_9FLAO|nr:RNA methyltransferase [Flavobacterium silvaticum]NMH27473.1 RNA methyltransferase [Flavobacterium silvaticum]
MRKLLNEELGRLTTEAFHEAQKMPLVIVLDDVRSGNNIGSVFRTADAFLVESIFLCGITATPPNKEINKTALGATETVAWEHFPSIDSALEKLKKDGYRVFAVEQIENSIDLREFEPEDGQKYALVFGNEVFGVSQNALEYCEAALEIPQSGSKHSLNIAVSAGVVVWDFYSKFMSVK